MPRSLSDPSKCSSIQVRRIVNGSPDAPLVLCLIRLFGFTPRATISSTGNDWRSFLEVIGMAGRSDTLCMYFGLIPF